MSQNRGAKMGAPNLSFLEKKIVFWGPQILRHSQVEPSRKTLLSHRTGEASDRSRYPAWRIAAMEARPHAVNPQKNHIVSDFKKRLLNKLLTERNIPLFGHLAVFVFQPRLVFQRDVGVPHLPEPKKQTEIGQLVTVGGGYDLSILYWTNIENQNLS